VGECLWKIPERGSRLRIDFLAEKPNIVGASEESCKGFCSPFHVTALRPALDSPEAADAERALAGR
jgi:hypothetical protein